MLSITYNLTPAGRIKKPFYLTVATQVKKSQDEVDEDLICRFFKCCEISTKTDGSEDHYISDYDKLSDPINDDDDEVIEVVNDNKEYAEEND